MNLLRQLTVAFLRLLIRGYQTIVSPHLPAACRYHPTCSQYALEAVTKYGPLRGSWLALRRLLRCHPIRWLGGGQGHDPVP